jgi:hypothetical protein
LKAEIHAKRLLVLQEEHARRADGYCIVYVSKLNHIFRMRNMVSIRNGPNTRDPRRRKIGASLARCGGCWTWAYS